MLNCLLTIALSLVTVAVLSACTAASAPGQGGISIPNLVTSPASPTPDSEPLPADYVYVESLDPDVPGQTVQTSSPRIILAAGRNRGSIRLASTGEVLVNVPYPATRYALIDMNADKVRDLIVLNGSAGPTEYGFRAFDMKKLLSDKALVDLNLNFAGPVYAAVEFTSTTLLIAEGDKAAEIKRDMTGTPREYNTISAKDVFLLNVKSPSTKHFGFHTTNDCGDYSFCIEIFNSSLSTRQGNISTNAQPGKFLSVFTDDIGDDGIVDSLYVADADRTSELYYDGLVPKLKNLSIPSSPAADIPSTGVSAKNMWDRLGEPRDLLILNPVEGVGAIATIYKEKVTVTGPSGHLVYTSTSTFEPDVVLNWSLPNLRGALVKEVIGNDDILLMESDSIHLLQSAINPDSDLEYTPRYTITD